MSFLASLTDEPVLAFEYDATVRAVDLLRRPL